MAVALWRSGASRTVGRCTGWSYGRAPTRLGLVHCWCVLFCVSFSFGVLARRRGQELNGLSGAVCVLVEASSSFALVCCFDIYVLFRLSVIDAATARACSSVSVICRLLQADDPHSVSRLMTLSSQLYICTLSII